ncbi:MAG: hypothetical protein KGZ83_00225 [Sulfuricella sp.]|nr:hypothetical protein [Sulfuricella sp.]
MTKISAKTFAQVFMLTLFLSGCAGQSAHLEGLHLLAEGKEEEGLLKLRIAVNEAPTNAEFRVSYLRLRDKTIAIWLDQANSAQASNQGAAAEKLLRRVLTIDPGNARAKAGLEDMVREARYRDLMTEAEEFWAKGDGNAALARLRTILSEAPKHVVARKLRQTIQQQKEQPPVDQKLSASLKKPITIEFKDAPLKQVFEVLSRTSGLNFVFDKDIKTDQKTTIFLRDSTIENAVNVLLLTNQLEQRILDKSSILIYPNTPAKARDYQPLTVKTFFLGNGDIKAAANTLKTILKAKDIVVDERQNMIVLRDTPDAIRLAEKLLAMHDLPEPEVMLEMEILEVTRTRLLDLGVRWPDQLSLAPLAGTGGSLTLADLQSHASSQIGATITPMTINVKDQGGNVKILANPRIRTRSRETAKILIGDRVPNITTTATATGFVSESVQYLDVGLKLEAQPTIFLENEVAIKLSLEVSNIVSQVQTKSGTLAYQLGTRSASTVLRLKDGENQVLAGLINDEDRSTGNRIPGIGGIPFLGRLFGSQRDDTTKTEIILSITPRLIRNIQRPSLLESEFDSGTEASLRSSSGGASAGSPSATSPSSQAVTNTGIDAPKNAIQGGMFPSSSGTGGIPSTGGGTSPLTGTPIASTTGNAIPLTNNPISSQAGSSTPLTSPPIGSVNGGMLLNWQAPAQVKVGDKFFVSLAIQPSEPIIGVPYSLGFDPKFLEIVSVDAGDFLKQGSATTNFTNWVDKNNGQILITETRSGKDGASNSGTLLTLTIKAQAITPQTSIKVITMSPLGSGGRSVTAPLPAPQPIEIRP